MTNRVIHIHPDAPVKPALGDACNGCGICCLAEPCPLGVLLSRRWRGACVALRWQDGRYVCGMLTSHAGGLRGRLLKRWIAAGAGCDCSLEPAGKP